MSQEGSNLGSGRGHVIGINLLVESDTEIRFHKAQDDKKTYCHYVKQNDMKY
jgi:hypothetical protein